MTCIRCNHDTAKKFGYYGKRRIQRYRCRSCRTTFAAPAPKLGTHYTDPETASKALTMMLEGMSVRAISRCTGLHLQTILALMHSAADRTRELMRVYLRNLTVRYIQADEIWGFVGKKDKNVRRGDSSELGSAWVFIALDPETKLIPCFEVGKRSRETTTNFVRSLREAISSERFQLTTDGFHFYEGSVASVFAGQADFAQLVKLYGDYGQRDAAARYSPGRLMEVISKVRDGRPDPKHISTSHVERSNLSLRMHLRRFTRLTNAFSKKLDNLKAALCLYFAWYNFCRVHTSIRVTPAMRAGLTDHVWSLHELICQQH